MRLIRLHWVRFVLAMLATAGLQLAGARAALGLSCAISTTVAATARPSATTHASVAKSAHTDAPADGGAGVAVISNCTSGASLPVEIVRAPSAPVSSSPVHATRSGAVTSFVPGPPFHPPRSV